MTQTLAPAPMTALTFRSPSVGVRLHLVPLTSVDLAREEFGATLADAEAFVLTTCCTECGMDAEATQLRECRDCEAPGCDCVLFEDPHSPGVFWCSGCMQVCGGYCCNED